METNGTFLERTAGNKYFWFAAAAALFCDNSESRGGARRSGLAIALTVGQSGAEGDLGGVEETFAAFRDFARLRYALSTAVAEGRLRLSVGDADFYFRDACDRFGARQSLRHRAQARRPAQAPAPRYAAASAIAAMAPAISASSVETGVAMAVIFLLNGIALFLFPPPRTSHRPHAGAVRLLGGARNPRHEQRRRRGLDLRRGGACYRRDGQAHARALDSAGLLSRARVSQNPRRRRSSSGSCSDSCSRRSCARSRLSSARSGIWARLRAST